MYAANQIETAAAAASNRIGGAFARGAEEGLRDLAVRAQPPAHAACSDAMEASMRTRKMAEELHMRLSSVMQPEGPQRGETAQAQTRPGHGGSPIVGSFIDLAQAAEGTAEVLADILRRLEV